MSLFAFSLRLSVFSVPPCSAASSVLSFILTVFCYLSLLSSCIPAVYLSVCLPSPSIVKVFLVYLPFLPSVICLSPLTPSLPSVRLISSLLYLSLFPFPSPLILLSFSFYLTTTHARTQARIRQGFKIFINPKS